MSASISADVFADDAKRIECAGMGGALQSTNTIRIDGLCIFASAETLTRIADAINARLAVIAAQEALQVAA